MKETQELKCYTDLNLIVQKCFFFSLKLIIVKNLRRSLFNDTFKTQNTSQIYLLNDFFKLEFLLSTMPSNNICTFMTELLNDMRTFLQQYNVLLYNLYRFNSIKTNEFYEDLIKYFFLQKNFITQEICEIFKRIFTSINIEALGEIGTQAFLSFIMKYEEFLRELKNFTSYFPYVPNELIFNLINEYINYFKQKSMKIMSPDFISENWSVIQVESHHFKEKIFAYLFIDEDLLKMSSLFKV